MSSDPNPDPSMEEILASIKRVINEDKRPGAVPAARVRRADAGPGDDEIPEEDVLELDVPMPEGEPLMSDERAAATRLSLAALARIRNEQPAAPPEEGPLEAAIKEMLRPMIKQWLDEKLPVMIEDMVAREISRITGQKF